MNLAEFSPRKVRPFNQSSPRNSAHKRSLFPSNSPQSSDLGLISELCSDDSDVYSSPLASPSSSLSPEADRGSPRDFKFDQILKNLNNLEFANSSPRISAKKMDFCKENVKNNLETLRKSRQSFLNKENFNDHFVLSRSPDKESMARFDCLLRSDSLTTPKHGTSNTSNKVWRSPRSASKAEITIKPKNFYGNLAPILATNQTNRIQGMKCVFRPAQPSKAKAKLFFEEKPNKKRQRSKSVDVTREAKKRKPIFTGVHHAVPKPVKHTSPVVQQKRETIREKVHKVTDLSRTPYSKTKEKGGWENTLKFTKLQRYVNCPYLGTKRKFFKTSIEDVLSSPPESASNISLCEVPKKRKLLDARQSYLTREVKEKPNIDVTDIYELVNDHDFDKLQDKPEVDNILLRLEEEDEKEKKKEAERQMLLNLLEDSPTKITEIDCLSNCTASLDLNDSFSGSGCSRLSLDDTKENQGTPRRMFSIFNSSASTPLSSVNSNSSSRKRKWHGVGESQMQIDAGQKRFGACQCPECGMVYQVGEAEDENQHNAFHNNLTTLRYQGWKNEKVVGSFGLDYALVVTGNDPKSWQQKALDVIALVDKSLGITSDCANVMHNQKVFLYISDKRIVGCMVATPVGKAFKMISSESDVDICSDETYPVRCGVSRMWTLYSHRRIGVATKLLDTVRLNFMYGCILSKDDIAFSIPTVDGKRFATKYMNTPNYFVYVGY